MTKFQNHIVKNDNFCKEICPNIWLMDDHKWAFWAWISFATQLKLESPLSLYHVDYHWDAVNDFQCEKSLSDIAQTDLTALFQLVSDDFIRKDGFIAPAIIKGIFDEVHFYCRQKDTEIGFLNEFLKRYHTKQYVHKTIESMCSAKNPKEYAFDLDIDVFNDSGMYLESDIWPESTRDEFFKKCKVLIQNASIITIAMSFGYSGTKNDTKSLAEYVLEKVFKIRNV